MITIDIETKSDKDITKCGVYAYADSPYFDILLFAYSVDGQPVQVIDTANGEKIPAKILSSLADEKVIKRAFNVNFERVCLSRYLSKNYPQYFQSYSINEDTVGDYLNPESWQCTMIHSRTLGLPSSLAEVGTVLGIEQKKMTEGKALIKFFCVPYDRSEGVPQFHNPRDYPDKWEIFKAYNKRDVEAEMEIDRKLSRFPVPDFLWREFYLDQEINDRGILVDMELADAAITLDEQSKAKLTSEMQRLTGALNPNSVYQLLDWLEKQGYKSDSLGKAQVQELIKTAKDPVKSVLEMRLQLSKSSVKKYTAMKQTACSDNRARGMFSFYGASRTGRWCLTGEHEVLTNKGWCRLDEWNGGYIACWSPHGDSISFQKANALSFSYAGDMYEYNDKRISQKSTPDHKMYVKKRYDKDWTVDTVENMAKYRPSIPFTGYRTVNSGMEHIKLRIMVMVQADGCYTESGCILLGFTKLRKVERCKKLLRSAGIMFSYKIYGNRHQFVIPSREVPLWLRTFKDKTFGTWLWDESADVFFDELVYWDGYQSATNSIQYSTCNKQNADIIQAFAHLSGRAAQMRIKSRKNEHPNWNDAYVLDIWLTPKNCHEIRTKPTITHFEGKVYCAETKTGFFLVRRNNKVWVTGNSGRNIQLQNLPQNHIPDLTEAREIVKYGYHDEIEMLYGDVPDTLSQLIRTAFIPRPGMKFIVADFNSVEARVLAWLAGEDWRMEAFAKGEDIYCASASKMFGVPVVKHGENGHLRQKGKVAELACIAEGQFVLTDHGLIPIEKVSVSDRVWDGVQWIRHEGVIYKGERSFITYDGLTATPDHFVWIKGRITPVPFGVAAATGSYLVNTGNDRIALQYSWKDHIFSSNEKAHEGQFLNKRKSRVYDLKNAGPNHRFTVSGKLVHNCGYGGSVGAMKAMGADSLGLSDTELKQIVTDWREASPNITDLWWAVDRAAKKAVKDRTTTETHGLIFSYESGFLFIELPSGRRLAYAKPRIGENQFGGESVTYMGINAQKKWGRLESYGPKFVENCVQGIARDLLMHSMQTLSHCFIVGHVHDEMIIEADRRMSVQEVCQQMSRTPAWAEGLILRAEGYECEYYKKE